jgi:hypothetical protein
MLQAARGGVFAIGDVLLVLLHGSYLERSSKEQRNAGSIHKVIRRGVSCTIGAGVQGW